MEPNSPNATGANEVVCSALFGVCLALGEDEVTGSCRAYVLTTRDSVVKLKPNIVRNAVAVVLSDDYMRMLGDKARLDWLEQQVERGYYNETTGRTELTEFSVAAVRRDGIRAAIDAAMSPPNYQAQTAAKGGSNTR